MPGRQVLRVILELEHDGPVRGAIVGPDGVRQPFYGWLELAAVLGGVRPHQAAHALDHATLLGDLPLSPEAGAL